MSYKNPLHIIRDKDLSSVSPENLKRWRKELMLRFNLGGGTAINVNGREYDKQGVTDTFVELEQDFAFHLNVFENKPLLDFLEKGSLTFFKEKEAQEYLRNNEFYKKIFPLLSLAYGQVLIETINSLTDENIQRLSFINRSFPTFISKVSDDALANAFGRFKELLDGFSRLSKNCFEKDDGYKLNQEIAFYVNPQMQELLKHLPTAFKDLKLDFSRTLRNKLLPQAFDNGKIHKLTSIYDTPTLQTLLTAAEIVNRNLRSHQVYQIIQSLNLALNGKDFNVESNNESNQPTREKDTLSISSIVALIWMAFLICSFLFKVVLNLDGCSGNSSGYAPRNKQSKIRQTLPEVTVQAKREVKSKLEEDLQVPTQEIEEIQRSKKHSSEINPTKTKNSSLKSKSKRERKIKEVYGVDVWRKSIYVHNNPSTFRFFVDKVTNDWLVEYEGKEYMIAKIIKKGKAVYFKPLRFTSIPSEIKPLIRVQSLYYFNEKGKKTTGPVAVTYHEKEDYFSVRPRAYSYVYD